MQLDSTQHALWGWCSLPIFFLLVARAPCPPLGLSPPSFFSISNGRREWVCEC